MYDVVADTRRGHVRPLLNLSVNLLALHLNLNLTLLLTPSASLRVAKELESTSFSYLREINASDAPAPKDKRIIDRLQVIDVKSPSFVLPEEFTFMNLMEEAEDFVETLPDFLKPMFGGKEVNGKPNKFVERSPDLIVFDVSLPCMKVFDWETE